MLFQYSLFALLTIVTGVLLGRFLVFKSKRLWIAGYIIAMALISYIGLAMRDPYFENLPGLGLLMRGRTEFGLIGFLVAMLISMLALKAENSRLKILLPLFGILITVFYSLFPFFLPDWYRKEFSSFKTQIDDNGVCRQNTDYTCGPAAAVTALRQLNVSAEEGELAILAFSNWVTGTPTDLLCDAINSRLADHNLECRTVKLADVSEIKNFPAIAAVEYGLLVDHYVTLTGWEDGRLKIADPLDGIRLMKKEAFLSKWRKVTIIFEEKRLQ